MRLLITGASGFVGRNLVCALPRDWTVTATYHRTEDFPGFLAGHGLDQVRPVRVDLATTDPEVLAERVGREHDAAIFLAANGDPALSVRIPRSDLAANALSVVAVLERVRIERLLFVSSGAVYDGLGGDVHPGVAVRPTLPYAISKLAAEHYVRSFTHAGHVRSAVSVRFFGAYGPHEPERKIYTRLVRTFGLEGGRTFTIRGDGRNLIDAMYVDDAVRGLLVLLRDQPTAGAYQTVDLAAGAPLTIQDLVRKAAATFNIEPEIVCAGEVPEYMEFRSADTTMRDRYQFRPEVPLGDGLLRLATHLTGAADAGRTRT